MPFVKKMYQEKCCVLVFSTYMYKAINRLSTISQYCKIQRNYKNIPTYWHNIKTLSRERANKDFFHYGLTSNFYGATILKPFNKNFKMIEPWKLQCNSSKKILLLGKGQENSTY